MKLTQFQQYIHLSRYARWIEEKQRRETWPETVDRYINFWLEKFPQFKVELEKCRTAIINMEIMPSMRALMTAGPALDRDNIAGYNCSYIAVNHPRVFDEILYILMCGTGVGFSVERQEISNLPNVPSSFARIEHVIDVRDSKIGWALALRELIVHLFNGYIPTWNLDKIRAKGARLKTFGGRSSGPEPLDALLQFVVEVFTRASGRKLTSIECHDIICKIADAVVVGGVRRSALISLSNLSDDRMRHAKTGQWWESDPQRALANNSAVYTEKPDIGLFMDEWKALYDSKSGERGIFNREAALQKVYETQRRDPLHNFGTNPCGEIILRSGGLCNLTEVVARENDSLDNIQDKIVFATFLGVLQATLTNFRYVRPLWKRNAEEERLLGVSITGIADRQWRDHELGKLKALATFTSQHYSDMLGISRPAAITTIKPSGTVSQLVDSSSGIHPRYSLFYIRTVRADRKDPLAQFMIQQGVPHEPDVTKPNDIVVFSFPCKSPAKSILRGQLSAIDQLEIYQLWRNKWCEHNPSTTIYVREHEWMDVGAWVYRNFNSIGGVSFLPYSDHTYRQAPYQEIDGETYDKLVAEMPEINWENFKETYDGTLGSQELACTSGVCDIL